MLPLALWIGAAVGALGAQDVGAPQDTPRFRSQADLVVLHVTVLTSRSGYVPDLPREAFTVLEDGHPQAIAFFDNTDSPVTVGLLLDNSISMMRRKPAVVAAGARFARSGHPDDELFVINFNERVWHALPPETPFTSDRDALDRALARVTARGQTALFDALGAGLRHLGHGSRQKKVLVVVSDGGDNASTATFDDVMAAALRMDAVIYTVSIHDPYDTEGDPRLLRRLADATGGEAFFVRSPDEISSVLDRIARDIRSGYTIGYVPDRPPRADEYREITVRVSPHGRQRLKVRARSGYVTSPGGATSP